MHTGAGKRIILLIQVGNWPRKLASSETWQQGKEKEQRDREDKEEEEKEMIMNGNYNVSISAPFYHMVLLIVYVSGFLGNLFDGSF